jgi:hypothetical protein
MVLGVTGSFDSRWRQWPIATGPAEDLGGKQGQNLSQGRCWKRDEHCQGFVSRFYLK